MATQLTKPVTRKTNARAATYGPDARRLIAVTLIPGGLQDDMIQLRPLRTQRSRIISVPDLWSMLTRLAANRLWAEKMAAKKKKKAEAAANAKLLRSIRSNKS